jgi:hypothetical protein
MEIRLFDVTKPLPFSQGWAINVIRHAISGKLEATGQVVSGGPSSGVLIYFRFSHTGEVKQSECLWFDDGHSMAECRYLRTDDDQWRERGDDGKWQPSSVEINIVEPSMP